jgi:hypothetical protein
MNIFVFFFLLFVSVEISLFSRKIVNCLGKFSLPRNLTKGKECKYGVLFLLVLGS